jgi:hypothetical protein
MVMDENRYYLWSVSDWCTHCVNAYVLRSRRVNHDCVVRENEMFRFPYGAKGERNISFEHAQRDQIALNGSPFPVESDDCVFSYLIVTGRVLH